MIKKLSMLTESISARLKIKTITKNDLIFEERVLLNCYYCPKYRVNHSCPPVIWKFDYVKIFSEYDNLLVVYYKVDFTGKEPSIKSRRESTNYLHKALLKMEKVLWDNGYPLAVSFIGGSCKLCPEGCPDSRCKNPNLRRTPLEACGINIVKSMAKIGIDVVFPPVNYYYRIGMLLW